MPTPPPIRRLAWLGMWTGTALTCMFLGGLSASASWLVAVGLVLAGPIVCATAYTYQNDGGLVGSWLITSLIGALFVWLVVAGSHYPSEVDAPTTRQVLTSILQGAAVSGVTLGSVAYVLGCVARRIRDPESTCPDGTG